MSAIELCICQHWLTEHSPQERLCTRCDHCGMGFFAVSSKSSHVYQRGVHHVVSTQVRRLKGGDKVLIRPARPTGIVPAVTTTHAHLGVVTHMTWVKLAGKRGWTVDTDMGTLPAMVETDRVLVAK